MSERRTDLIELLHARGLFRGVFEDLFGIADDAWKNGSATILCPFHDEKTASMNVNSIEGVFNCFGCGAHGGVFHALEREHGLNREDARKWIVDWLSARGEHVEITDGAVQPQEELAYVAT